MVFTPGQREDLSDACASLDKLDIQHRRVRFSDDNIIGKNPKYVKQDGGKMLEETKTTSKHVKGAGEGVCESVDKSENIDAAGEVTECKSSNTMQTGLTEVSRPLNGPPLDMSRM